MRNEGWVVLILFLVGCLGFGLCAYQLGYKHGADACIDSITTAMR